MTRVKESTIYHDVLKIMYLHSSRKHDEAFQVSERVFSFFEANTSEYIQGLYYFVLGMRQHVNSQFKDALLSFSKGIETSNDTGDVAAINHLGTAFSSRSLGNLDEAVIHLFKVLEQINIEGVYNEFLRFCYVQLGEIHVAINEPQSALEFFNKVFTVRNAEKQNNALIFNSIGNCYLHLKEYEQSHTYLLKALNSEGISEILLSKFQFDLGVLYLERNQLEEAQDILYQSLEIRKANNLEDASGTNMCLLAETYIKMNRISDALHLLNEGKSIVQKYHTRRKELKILSLLAKAHALNGDHKIAFEFYERYIALQNEVKNEQEKNILKIKNEQIDNQKKIIQEKHRQLAETFEEIKQLKINRKAVFFSWVTVIVLVLVSEMFIDPLIENYAYNNLISLFIKICIALLFKPLDGLYESILWNKTIQKANEGSVL